MAGNGETGMMRKIVLLAGLGLLSPFLRGQVVPSDRIGDWARSGVFEDGVKGIPHRSTVYCNVKVKIPGSPLLARGDGTQDDSEALQAAISTCPQGQVVLIPQGTYRISRSLVINKGIVVRGDGPTRTRIVQHAPTHVFVVQGTGTSFWYAAVGGHPELGIVQSLRSGYSRGSDTVVVADSAACAIGNVVLIDQLNDPALVTAAGTGGSCTWCGLGTDENRETDGSRAMAETLVIKKIAGNAITFHRPLQYDFASRFLPRLIVLSNAPVRNAGIEDLGIEAAEGNTEGSGIVMTYSVHCWVRNIESFNIPQKHIEIEWAACGNEVRDSLFHHTPRFDADHGYGVNIRNYATDNLIENNVFYGLHTGVVIGSAGGSGNVVAYNFVDNTRHRQPNWFLYQIGTHGAHTYMNLFEGNVCGKIGLDSYWGSGSHSVFFRNVITRENTAQPVTQDINAVNIEAFNYFATVVGNILGTPECRGPSEQIPFRNSQNNPVLWKVGFAGSTTGYPADPKVALTLIRTGNWECATNAVQWTSDGRRLPDSLYLPLKPAWFGALIWPPFTPERAGFDPKNLNKIPAQLRFAQWSQVPARKRLGDD
jgi:hypothetical protein